MAGAGGEGESLRVRVREADGDGEGVGGEGGPATAAVSGAGGSSLRSLVLALEILRGATSAKLLEPGGWRGAGLNWCWVSSCSGGVADVSSWSACVY